MTDEILNTAQMIVAIANRYESKPRDASAEVPVFVLRAAAQIVNGKAFEPLIERIKAADDNGMNLRPLTNEDLTGLRVQQANSPTVTGNPETMERRLKEQLVELEQEYKARAAPIIEAIVKLESMKPPRHIWPFND